MKAYRKLVAAIVGAVAILLGPDILAVTPGEQLFGIGQETAIGIIMAIGSALGVWAVPNDTGDGS